MSEHNQPKIILIIPYFGSWPSWINYFIRSCAQNPTITWLMYTDCGEPEYKADNVIFKHCSFALYQQKVSTKLGINFSPESPYKLCDLKPALGYIHEKEIAGYDYWGFGDVDVIYGDIRAYLTDQMFRFNLISFHEHRVSGHLCLLKNSVKMRHAFMQVREWRKILADNTHRCFDEKHFNALFIRHKNWPKKLRRIIYFPRYLMRTAYFKESHSTNYTYVPWIDGSFDFPRYWHWDNGVLMAENTPGMTFPYLHFLHWKQNWKEGHVFEVSADENHWVLSEKGFSSHK